MLQLIREENGYEIEVLKFTSDIFPTDIKMVLVNCFYKQKDKIEEVGKIFIANFEKLTRRKLIWI